MNKFDYIVTGSGAAGLSLLMHMIGSGKFTDKKILLLDKEQKTKNDRTWCFWEQQQGIFDPIVHKSWNTLLFYGSDGKQTIHLTEPYQYKLIRGIDFYNYCFGAVGQQKNISIRYGNVESCHSDHDSTYVVFNGEKIFAEYVFNSIIFQEPEPAKKNYFLLQHFGGWFIRTRHSIFDPSKATLMDFRIAQDHGTTFMYIMPFTETEALVEYTVFSPSILSADEYDEQLQNYCSGVLQLRNKDFEVVSRENGVIPMTNFSFPGSEGNVINIGTAGGQTKPSSGYTFNFIQKDSEQIVNELAKGNLKNLNRSHKKFNFYDSILLNILVNKKLQGASIFTNLFRNNKISDVFKFLDNETSLTEDLHLIKKLPRAAFSKAAFSHIFGMV